MTIDFQHDEQKTDFTVNLDTKDKLEEGSIEVFKSLTEPGAQAYAKYAKQNGFDPQEELLVVLRANYNGESDITNVLNYTKQGLKDCEHNNSTGTHDNDCRKIFAMVYRVKPMATGPLGNDRSGNKVKDDQGGDGLVL